MCRFMAGAVAIASAFSWEVVVCVPKPRSPDRDRAFEIYKAAGGDIPLADIATQLGLPEGTVRGWKNKDGWDAKLNGTFRKNTERSKRDKKVARQMIASVEANDELTEMQKDFCLHMTNIWNQTQAAIRAGYSPATAYSIGYNLMQLPAIRAEIQRLKEIKRKSIMAGPEDIVDRMMRIAFSDMRDFVDFEGGTVRLKHGAEVDGGLIKEISETEQGAKIKLLDSQKALEWLARYFEMNPADRHRRDYDAKRLELMERQVRVQESKNERDDGSDRQIPGLIEGLKDGK